MPQKSKQKGKASSKRPAKKEERTSIPVIEEEFLTAEDQPYLFGEADMILNTLEMELKDWSDKLDKLYREEQRLEEKTSSVRQRMIQIKKAIEATAKHAPKQQDPAAPQKETEEERAQDKREEEKLFREASGPGVPDLIKPGDIIHTSWGSGPFRVEEIEGPFTEARISSGEEGKVETLKTPPYYRLKCSDVNAPEGKREEYKLINYVIGVNRRLVNLFESSDDFITLALPKGEASNAFRKVTPTEKELF